MRATGLAFLVVCLSLVLCSSTHARQLNQEDTGFRHCQREAGSETALSKQQQYVETFVAGEFHDTRANDDNQHPHKNNQLYSM